MDFGVRYLELRSWLIIHPNAILLCTFLLAMTEAVAVIGTIVPAIPALFVLSLLAAHADVPFTQLLAAGILGAMTGDGVSYALGHGFTHRIEHVWPFKQHPEWLERAEAFVAKHGGKSIIFGRFIGPLRAFVPMAAGIFRMKPIHFVWMNFISALAWAPVHLLPGYSLGAATAHDWMPGRPQLLLIGALLILVAVLTWLLPALDGWRRRIADRYGAPANVGRCLTTGDFPEDQRASLRLALFAFAAFAILTCLLPWLKPMDMRYTSELFSLRQNMLDLLFVGISILGGYDGLLAFGTVVLIWLLLRGEWGTALMAIIVTLLGLTLPALIKLLVELPRPMLVMAPPESLSYPSGHAFSAVLAWGFVMVFLDRFRNEALMGLVRPILLSLILFTITARPYLGVHWISDVLAGALLGLACLALLRWFWYRHAVPRVGLWESVFVFTLALSISLGLEVWPHLQEELINYQPLPGLLPGYLLLP
jgi:undecaprenyl-diphosphatase